MILGVSEMVKYIICCVDAVWGPPPGGPPSMPPRKQRAPVPAYLSDSHCCREKRLVTAVKSTRLHARHRSARTRSRPHLHCPAGGGQPQPFRIRPRRTAAHAYCRCALLRESQVSNQGPDTTHCDTVHLSDTRSCTRNHMDRTCVGKVA